MAKIDRNFSIKSIPNSWKQDMRFVNGLIVCHNSKIVHANESILGFLGLPEERLVGQTLENFFKLIGIDHTFPKQEIMNCQNYIELDFKKGNAKYKITIDSHEISVNGDLIQVIAIKQNDPTNNQDRELNYYLEFERVVSSISQDFINCRYDEIDNLIDQALSEVGIISGVDRVYLFQINDEYTMSNTHEWTSQDINPYIDDLQNLPRDHFNWIDQQLKNNEIIVVNDVNELPEEASYEKHEFEREGIKSIILIPLIYSNEYFGFVGYDQVKYQRNWQNAIVSILSVVGEIIVHSLQRFRIEKALRDNEEKYRLLFEKSLDGIYRTSFDGRILEANVAFFDILGYEREEMDRIFVPDLYVNPEDRQRLKEALVEYNTINNLEVDLKTKNGKRIIALISVELVRDQEGNHNIYGVLKDITNFKKATEALIESEKLNSLAILSGAIAHDFNNLLTSIMGYSSLVLNKNPEPEIYDLTQKISYSSAKASELSNKLLAYSGQKTIITKVVDLKDEVLKNKDFIAITTPSSSIIEYHLEETGNVELDHTQFDQVLMNIVSNAVEAVDLNTGRIIITTGKISKNEIRDIDFEIFQFGDILVDSYAFVKIEDNGQGIPHQELVKIFEPFYTTKEGGKGLGLSATVGIMKSHKGAIGVITKRNLGTTFWLFFPSTDKPKDIMISQKRKSRNIAPRGKILLVDDDSEVLNVLQMMMKFLNIEYEFVSSGEQAITALEGTNNFDLVIMDQSMPGMSGMETIQTLRQKGINLPVIISSGYSEEIIKLDHDNQSNLDFLQKPYTMENLREVLSKFLH